MHYVVIYVDGTFSTVPTIFSQAFTILGSMSQKDKRGNRQSVGLPFMYGLLENKEKLAYKKVFEKSTAKARTVYYEWL